MKCPYRTRVTETRGSYQTITETEFVECLKEECPFYDSSMIELRKRCERAKSEAERGKR